LQDKLTFGLLFLLAFVVFPIGVTPFETPKVLLAEFIMGLVILLNIQSKSWLIKISNSKFLYFFGGLVVLSLFNLIFYHTSSSLFGNSFRPQGTVLLWFLLFFSLFSKSLDWSKINSSFILVLLAVQLLLAIFVSTGTNRAVGSLGEPNALAGFAIFLWPFLFLKSADRSSRITGLVGLIMTFLLVLFSGSRSGLVALIIQLIFLTLTKFRVPTKKSTLTCVSLIFISLSLPFLNISDSYENRVEVWQTALRAGLDKPVLGWGFGNTQVALHQASLELNNSLRGYVVDSSHNIFLDFFVQGGLVGLVLFSLILFFTFKNLMKKDQQLELMLLLGLITVMNFNPSSIVNLIQLWYLVGVVLKEE
jgi:O-antigen ligase